LKIRFMPLDASYEVRGRRPVIIIWGIDRNDERIALLVEGFHPYFYALLSKDAEWRDVASRVKALSKPSSPIVAVEPVERRYYGRPAQVLRITTIIPEYVRTYREQVAKIRGVEEVLEADIRFVMRYLMDKDVRPFSWYEVEVEEQGNVGGMRVGRVYKAKSDPRPVEDSYMPSLRVLAFDIEVYAPSGTPHPSKDPVIIISTMNEQGEVRQFTASGHDDKGVIEGFAEYVRRHDPDIIVGYNSNKFDWPYLLERAKRLGVKLDVSRRVGVEPATSVYGHISVAGRLNVDLYDYAEEMPEIKVKSLENVAEYLGVMKKSERTIIEWYEMPKYWDDPAKRGVFLQYARDDVVATYGVAEKILPFAIQLSFVTGLPLDQVGAASVGFRLEWYLMREAYKYGELVPNRRERPPLSYRGAIVLEPRKGVHDNIAVLDFSSMYPNIMIKYNVGPDTILRPGEPEPPEGVWVAPEVGHRFRKNPPGFFKKVLEYLLKLRRSIKDELKKYPPDTPEYRVLNERQKAVKVLANATYGYMGWTAARWYCRECAEAVTAWGRQTISKALEIARSLGLATIYGDSVSGDTEILVRKNGEIRLVKIAELFSGEPDQRSPDGKEYRFLKDVETITIDRDGRLVWKPICYVMRHKAGKHMYRIWLTDDWYIDVTEDHSLISYVNTVNGERVNAERARLVEVKPTELREHAEVLVVPNAPIISGSEVSSTDERIWEFVGLAVGNGSSVEGKHSGRYYVELSLGEDKEEISERLLKQLEKAGVISNQYEEDGRGVIIILSRKLAEILRDFEVSEGRIIPAYMLSMPDPLIRAFLRGYSTANGAVMLRDGKPLVRLAAANKNVARMIRALLFITGISNSVLRGNDSSRHIVVKNVVGFAEKVGFLSDRENKRLLEAIRNVRENGVRDVGFDLQAVRRIERIGNKGYVYDIEVESTHRFFANWILVHNTDSLFVSYKPGAVEEFIRRIEEELGFDIKVDKLYTRVFFTEAKKRYIGLLSDGRIDIVGFEAIRGDWAEIAKEIQEQVAEIILRKGDVEEAVRHVRRVIERLREGKIPLEKLVIWKTLTKPLKEYAVEAPHVAAARRMQEAGYKVEVGDKIGYIVVRGKGRLSDKAYPYFMVSPDQVDYDYYAERQIIPAALRILGYYGITETRLKAASKGQKSLFDYLG